MRPRPRILEMDGERPVFAAVASGDQVQLGHWRGEIRAVAAHGHRPDDPPPLPRARRASAQAPPRLDSAEVSRTPEAAAVRSGEGEVGAAGPEHAVPAQAAVLLAVAGFMVGLAVREPGPGLVWTAVGALLLVPVSAWRLRLVRRGPCCRPVSARARTPAREQVFPGLVHGEVPYAGHRCLDGPGAVPEGWWVA